MNDVGTLALPDGRGNFISALDRWFRLGQSRPMPETGDLSELSFEAALQRLEGIVRKLESGEAPLEQAISLYEEAQALKAHCDARLSDAEARIAMLQLDAEGRPVSETPFAN